MHVVVLGAGVVGVTTAYYLSRHGCEVTVVDRASDVGDGASFANAGQLSYSFTDSLAKPEFLAHIPALMLGRDEGVQVRLTPELVTWGTRFVGQCTRRHARENTLAVLKIALRSAGLMAELRDVLPFDFWHRKAGKLVLLSSQAEVMRDTVHDLAILVGGNATAVAEFHPQQQRTSRRRQVAAPRLDKRVAQLAIPFGDDEDFADFEVAV